MRLWKDTSEGGTGQTLIAFRKTETALISGLILLHWSQPVTLVSGKHIGLACLAFGFLLILVCTFWRGRFIPEGTTLIGGSVCYAALLMVNSVMLEHAFISNPLAVTFHLIVISLFICGFVLGATRGHVPQLPTSGTHVIMAAIAIGLSIAFARQLQASESYGIRGFGDVGLNPNGVAYVIMCLGLIFLVLAIKDTSPLSRALCSGAAAATMVLVLGCASRGAVLWGTIVGMLLLVVQRISRSTMGRVLQVLALILVAGLVVTYAARRFPVLQGRIDQLKYRFTSIIEDIENSQISDMSINARKNQMQYYRHIASDWWLRGLPGYRRYPHNQWMEIAVRFGMLGVPFLIFSLWSITKALQRMIRGGPTLSREELAVYTLFVFAYLQSMSSLALQVNRVLFLGFGYILGAHAVQKKAHDPGQPR